MVGSSTKSKGFSQLEWKTVLTLTCIMIMRLYGLFVVIPVIVIESKYLAGWTAVTAGIAIGIYGLSQALLQIPLGMMSDRFGRKTVMFFGLIVFIVGGLICALAENMHWLIFGRLLQGSAALASVNVALMADLVRSSQRTKALAISGISVGVTFWLAMISSPFLVTYYSLPWLFWMSAILGILALPVLIFLVPNPTIETPKDFNVISRLYEIIQNKHIVSYCFSVFFLHLIFISLFLVLPGLFIERMGYELSLHGWIYIVVFFISVLLLPLLLRIKSNFKSVNSWFYGMLVCLIFSFLLMIFLPDSKALWLSLVFFFASFNALETWLPSQLTQSILDPSKRGGVSGMFHSFQFFGISLGGGLSGWVFSFGQVSGVLWFCIMILLLWIVLYSWCHLSKSSKL